MIRTLEEQGLSENEAKVYLAGLKIKLGKVSKYAKETGLPRSTTHDILNVLKKKGLVSGDVVAGARTFSAVDPKRFLDRLDEKRKKFLKKLPELQKIFNTEPETIVVKFHKGVEGFKTLANELLEGEHKVIYARVAADHFEFLPIFHLQFRRKRREKCMKVKLITEKNLYTKELKRNDKKDLRETKFLDSVMKNATNSTFIYGDKVTSISVTAVSQTGTTIKDKARADIELKIFKVLWCQSASL